LFYTHYQYQGQGIGKHLYAAIEAEARACQKDQNPADLYAQVSLTAMPFFTSRGFIIEYENKVSIDKVELINYRMKKDLK